MKTQNRVGNVYLNLAPVVWSKVKYVHEATAPPLVAVMKVLAAVAVAGLSVLKHPRLLTHEELTRRGVHFPRSG